MFTESAGQVVLVPRGLQLPCSPLTVRLLYSNSPILAAGIKHDANF